MSVVERALAQRARAALEAGPEAVRAPGRARGATAAPGVGDRQHTSQAPSASLLNSLRHHLLAGETHYPDRPGMVELRRLVGAALPGIGYPEREPDGVLITASEGEALFVTLLGVGPASVARVTGGAPGRHRRLFDWMGPAAADPADSPVPVVHIVGDRLFASASGRADRSGTQPRAAVEPHAPPGGTLDQVIVIGSLDGLSAMRPFRLGFVAAPPKTLARITKWKQASSICSPAPSQRAALWALGVRP